MSNHTAERVAEVIEKHVGDLVNDVHFGDIVDDILAAVGLTEQCAGGVLHLVNAGLPQSS